MLRVRTTTARVEPTADVARAERSQRIAHDEGRDDCSTSGQEEIIKKKCKAMDACSDSPRLRLFKVKP